MGLKVSSLACKSVFYRPKHNVKDRPHETVFWRSSNRKMKYTYKKGRQKNDSWKSRWKKLVQLSSCHVYIQNYGH